MSTLLRFWLPAILAAIGVGAFRSPPVITIGVVDLAKAIEQYPKAIKMRTELKALVQSFQAKIDEINRRIDELRENIKVLAAESLERRQKEYDHQRAVQDREFMARLLVEQRNIADDRMQLTIYEDLEVAVKKVAANRGVQLVLRVHDPGPAPGPIDKLPARTVQERGMIYDRRQVWVAADEIDLTGDLIKLLQVPLENEAAVPAGKGGDK